MSDLNNKNKTVDDHQEDMTPKNAKEVDARLLTEMDKAAIQASVLKYKALREAAALKYARAKMLKIRPELQQAAKERLHRSFQIMRAVAGPPGPLPKYTKHWQVRKAFASSEIAPILRIDPKKPRERFTERENSDDVFKLSDSFYATKKRIREAVEMRCKVQQELMLKEREAKLEQELKALAQTTPGAVVLVPKLRCRSSVMDGGNAGMEQIHERKKDVVYRGDQLEGQDQDDKFMTEVKSGKEEARDEVGSGGTM